MNQTKMFQADMFGGPAVATTAPSTRPQAPAQQTTMFDDLLTGAAADLVGKGQIPPAYRSILALAELDSNRQALAVEALGTGRVSTPGAFRAYCAQLGKAQADEASEKTAGALLLGAAPESAILPDAADVAPGPALDAPNEATNMEDMTMNSDERLAQAKAVYDAATAPALAQYIADLDAAEAATQTAFSALEQTLSGPYWHTPAEERKAYEQAATAIYATENAARAAATARYEEARRPADAVYQAMAWGTQV